MAKELNSENTANCTYKVLTKDNIRNGDAFGLVSIGTESEGSDLFVAVQRSSNARTYRCSQHGTCVEEVDENKFLSYKCVNSRCGFIVQDTYPPHKLNQLMLSGQPPFVVKKKK